MYIASIHVLLQSLSDLKLALRVCAAFRGCYLDYKEKADTWIKTEAVEQPTGRCSYSSLITYMYMYMYAYIIQFTAISMRGRKLHNVRTCTCMYMQCVYVYLVVTHDSHVCMQCCVNQGKECVWPHPLASEKLQSVPQSQCYDGKVQRPHRISAHNS